MQLQHKTLELVLGSTVHRIVLGCILHSKAVCLLFVKSCSLMVPKRLKSCYHSSHFFLTKFAAGLVQHTFDMGKPSFKCLIFSPYFMIQLCVFLLFRSIDLKYAFNIIMIHELLNHHRKKVTFLFLLGCGCVVSSSSSSDC